MPRKAHVHARSKPKPTGRPGPFIAKDAGIRAAINAIGSGAVLAKAIGISPAAVYRWGKVPTDRIKEIERLTGVPREKLRPDLY
jgi:DNA-binding transcriptional regulator YdaS (Cro superfamily)